MTDGVNPLVKIRAVRGPISRMRAQACEAKCPRIYGDPAMILPDLYTPKPGKRHGLGFIPHYVDQFRVGEWYKGKGHIINVLQDVESFVDEVASCERIISSSLHGIIIAHAYGVPAVWAKWSDSIGGDGTKYRDYYTSVGIEDASHADLRNGGLCEVPNFVPKHDVVEFRKACPII
jgi:hypothetical protein